MEARVKFRKLTPVLLMITSLVFLTGFGLDDIKKNVPGLNKESKDDCGDGKALKNCVDKETIETGAEIVAVGIAAKLIHDMVIEYKVSQTKDEKNVVKEYSKKNKTLPAEPQIVEYKSSVKPGEVVKAGKEVLVESNLVVVPGSDGKPVDIQERIDIYDNEDNSKMLKTLTKPVNEKTKKTGAYKNQFKFTLPVGMPQGVYPIKTLVLLNGKTSDPSNAKMQLVLNVDKNGQYRVLALRD